MAETKEIIYSVADITRNVKYLLENNFSAVWIEGEISNFKQHSSGHLYFTLKDSSAQIKAVMFKGSASKIKFKVGNGIKVRVYGPITVYEAAGNYQINVRKMQPEGMGELELAFQQLKEKLEKEGLFSEDKKKKIPLYPRTVGIVTSPTGAAVRDMLNVLNRRFANLNVIIYPANVQGVSAKDEIAQAIYDLNEMNEVEVIIIGRGGGSIEDLWAFNEEVVARAVFASKIPIISAVGHEIDFTISDFVADLRVPTPSAAAELVCLSEEHLTDKINLYEDKIVSAMDDIMNVYRTRVEMAEKNYAFRQPENMLIQFRQKIDEIENKMQINVKHFLEIKKQKLTNAAANLEAFNPLGVLKRGYSINTDSSGKTIRSVADVKEKQELKTTLVDGEYFSNITKIVKK